MTTKSYLYLTSVMLAVINGCGNSELAEKPTRSPVTEEPKSSDQTKVEPEKKPTPPPAKTEEFANTPVNCFIDVGDTTAVWNNYAGWKESVAKFQDKTAQFVSLQKQGTSVEGHKTCGDLAADKQLFYLTTFTVATEDDFLLEFINDDNGKVNIWNTKDMKKTLVTWDSGAEYVQKSVKMKPGTYSIGVSSTDDGQAASAILFSMTNSKKEVIINTHKDKPWCIFDLPKDKNAIDHVYETNAKKPLICKNK